MFEDAKEELVDEQVDTSLHEAVFRNDLPQISALLRSAKERGQVNHNIKHIFLKTLSKDQNDSKVKNVVSAKDHQGNTALHLAVMLGRKEAVQLLIHHGAPVKLKNGQGWSPLAEAISYGDRATIASLLRKLKQQTKAEMGGRRPDMIEALRNLGDFCLELKWDFSSWVPLVSRILPSDICRISKKGASVRLDTTLVDFSEMK